MEVLTDKLDEIEASGSNDLQQPQPQPIQQNKKKNKKIFNEINSSIVSEPPPSTRSRKTKQTLSNPYSSTDPTPLSRLLI